MEIEKDAFYVVRKGGVVGVYKSLDDCQALIGSSVCNPSVSIYKGYSLPEKAEDYLASHGFKNATHSISTVDVTEEIFGTLVPCPFQASFRFQVSVTLAIYMTIEVNNCEPSSKSKAPSNVSSQERWQEVLHMKPIVREESTVPSRDAMRKPVKLGHSIGEQTASPKCESDICVYVQISCTLKFAGSSKGNPGQAGAGAILQAEDGSLVCQLREGLGVATCNIAEYRALILGLKHVLKKGFQRVNVQGDSKLICSQVLGEWKIKNENMYILCKEAKELLDKFQSFEIRHVHKELLSEAAAQARLAANLEDGQIQEAQGEVT
ncbi:hypothetical protein GIB67_004272 [Kingdonia uniflora]|uniref:RNase H type-1 domain-containing protein n=1 Tax=Kingdonia uniflora TaxID=39325 RepID=A0A7J7MR62_9MAGN|nr:hypothetical protein GIB67_004272 [Kingdonia uniflora]